MLVVVLQAAAARGHRYALRWIASSTAAHRNQRVERSLEPQWVNRFSMKDVVVRLQLPSGSAINRGPSARGGSRDGLRRAHQIPLGFRFEHGP